MSHVKRPFSVKHFIIWMIVIENAEIGKVETVSVDLSNS